jgi:putative photosynthetic complex assembly protein 2
MIEHGWPFLFTLLVWWLSTGVILYLDGLPRTTFKWTMGAFTALLIIGFWGLLQTKNDDTVAGAYAAFVCALLIWAWQEVAFLLGYITGSRRTPCIATAAGLARFRAAFGTVNHHEVALVVLGLAIFAMTWHGENATGLWTFLSLWLMRQSAKLNVYLGVRNLSEAFLPPHLDYLKTYFSRKSMNPLFPVSIVLATALATVLWTSAVHSAATTFDSVSLTFVATLLSLGVLEHWLMMLPVAPESLWRWAMRKPEETGWKPAHIAK